MRHIRIITSSLALLTLAVSLCGFKTNNYHEPVIHAHRGGAALYPENTIEAMINAVDMGVPVLEMDLHVTKDNKVVVSHDSHVDSVLIYSVNYDSLRKFDVGSRPNPKFPKRKNIACHIPLISKLIDSVENYVAHNNLSPVSYNIEIKSWPDKDGVESPDYKTFCDLCMKELLRKNLGDRLLVQCFDPRSLNYIHSKYPNVRLSFLIEEYNNLDLDGFMEYLEFVPQYISPDYKMVDKAFVEEAHRRNMKIAAWTVDTRKDYKKLKKLGVDAIITNNPYIAN